MNSITIKVLMNIPGYKAGKKVKVETNGGVPVLKFWRDRLRDAEIDNCVKVLKSTKKTVGEK